MTLKEQKMRKFDEIGRLAQKAAEARQRNQKEQNPEKTRKKRREAQEAKSETVVPPKEKGDIAIADVFNPILTTKDDADAVEYSFGARAEAIAQAQAQAQAQAKEASNETLQSQPSKPRPKSKAITYGNLMELEDHYMVEAEEEYCDLALFEVRAEIERLSDSREFRDRCYVKHLKKREKELVKEGYTFESNDYY